MNEFESIKKSFYKIQDDYILKKSEELIILGDEDNTSRRVRSLQKANLIEAEEGIVWKQGERVEQMKRSAVEMEVISVDVMRQLHGQTDQMKHIHGKVNDLNGNLEESNLLLNGMSRMVTRNKLIMIIFAVVLILAIIFVIIFRLLNSNTN